MDYIPSDEVAIIAEGIRLLRIIETYGTIPL